MKILGLWDGHDSGAALIVDGEVMAAVNEERFTRRKLEVAFPVRSIETCCQIAGISPETIDVVAFSTSDSAKTLTRLLPAAKETYYRVRRRKAAPGRLSHITRVAKYQLTEWSPNRFTRALSRMSVTASLRAAGVTSARVRLYDHHDCHAMAAGMISGFEHCAVLTIDGVGDGLASTVSVYEAGRLRRIAATRARHSPGLFFEHVTHLLNMRELEDEGKVMALADHAALMADDQNPLMELLGSEGLQFTTTRTGRRLRRRLRELLWFYPNEQFAAMAQRALERACVAVAVNVLRETGLTRLALSGGVASNIKINRHIRLLPELEDMFVFPHMGDGGLALGAALMAAAHEGVGLRALNDLALGTSYDASEIAAALRARGVDATQTADIAQAVTDLITRGEVVLWFQGRMEYGPRALGHRSVLARADRPDLRDRLNLVLKRRVWYQPFCPSLLESDARRMFEELKGSPNRHMTTAYMVDARYRAALAGVINVDGSCRPQIVPDDDATPFGRLLRCVRERTGVGALLNSSFNIHGEAVVNTPAEAVSVFLESGADALAIGSFLVRREHGTPEPDGGASV